MSLGRLARQQASVSEGYLEKRRTLRIERLSDDYPLTDTERRVTRFPQSFMTSARWLAKLHGPQSD